MLHTQKTLIGLALNILQIQIQLHKTVVFLMNALAHRLRQEYHAHVASRVYTTGRSNQRAFLQRIEYDYTTMFYFK